MSNESPAAQGSAVTPKTITPEEVAALLDKKLGDANVQKRGFSTGVFKDREFRGVNDEQIRVISGMTGNFTVLDIAHDLGRPPAYVALKGASAGVGAPPPHVTVADVDYDRWTDTVARIEVASQGAGGLDGVTLRLVVGGERG